MDRVCLVVGCLLHWLVAQWCWLWGRDPTLWVFGARSGADFVDNPKYLFLHIAANHPEIRPVWLTRDRSLVAELHEHGYEAHYTYSPRAIVLNLRADAVVLSHGLRDVNLWCCGGARAILLWHGTPLKHISWDAQFPDEPRLVQLAHRYAHQVLDLVLVTAEELVDIFAGAFGIDAATIEPIGYPRTDALFERVPGEEIGSDPEGVDTVRETAENHRILLYLPTFRKVGGDALAAFDPAELDSLLARHDATLFVKPHPNDPMDPERLDAQRVRGLPERTDVQPLLRHADVLVTDYSSVFVDFLGLDRPVVFYAHDLDAYRAERGFYFEYDAITPGPIARTPTELLAALESALDERDEYAAERTRVRERLSPHGVGRSEAVYRAIRTLL